MDIKKRHTDNQLIVTLSGELNTMTAPQFSDAMHEEVNKGESIIIDMTDVPYVTSAGIRVLLALDASNGGKPVILRGVCDEIREVLELTGLDAIMNIE